MTDLAERIREQCEAIDAAMCGINSDLEMLTGFPLETRTSRHASFATQRARRTFSNVP